MSADALTGTVALSRYEIEVLAAHGGMASVYRARDPVLNRVVAVKILHPHLAADESYVMRFRREALAAAGLSHPSIVSIFDTGDVGNRPCLVMEYLPGGSLADRLARGPLDPTEAVALGVSVAKALHEAHKKGLVHRDVKPANILFTESGTAKLGDFGIAKAGSDHFTQTGQVIGTARYLAPEQLRGQPASPKSDQFALGVVLYEALAGRPPFGGPTDPTGGLVRAGPMPPLGSLAAVPPALEAAVMRALDDEPDRRFPDLEAMAAVLPASLRPGGPPPATRAVAPPFVEPPSRPRAPRRGPRIVIGAFLALLLAGTLVAGAFLASRQGSSIGPLGSPKAPSTDASKVIKLVGAKDFDPEGDDRQEHPDEVALAIDGNTSTVWTTSGYEQQFPSLKRGVGIWVDLGGSHRIGTVKVVSGDRDWKGEVRVSDDAKAPTTLEAFKEAGTVSAGTPSAALDVQARRVLIWITALPPNLKMTIGEIQVSAK